MKPTRQRGIRTESKHINQYLVRRKQALSNTILIRRRQIDIKILRHLRHASDDTIHPIQNLARRLHVAVLLQVIHQALHATKYGRALPHRTAEDTAEGRGARVRQDVLQENVRFEQEQPAPLDAGGVVHLRVVRLALAAFLDGHATFEHAFLAAPVQGGAVHAAGA